LLKFGPIVDDSDFSTEQLKDIYNGELANGLGNTISRVFTLAERNNIKFETPESLFLSLNEDFLNFRPDKSLELIFSKISDLNKDINEKEPWKITDKTELDTLLKKYLNEIYYIILNLKPYIPETCEGVLESLKNNYTKKNFFPRLN